MLRDYDSIAGSGDCDIYIRDTLTPGWTFIFWCAFHNISLYLSSQRPEKPHRNLSLGAAH